MKSENAQSQAKATNTPVRDFATSNSVRGFSSLLAQKEFVLYYKGDEPEPGYFDKSESWKTAKETRPVDRIVTAINGQSMKAHW